MKRSIILPEKIRPLMDWLVRDAGLVMADIGARGELDQDLVDIAEYVDAIGFEPDRKECERLSKEAGAWKSVTHIPCAVGAEDGLASLYLTDSPESASLRPHNASLVEEFGYENMHVDRSMVPVETATLNTLLKKNRFPRVDYLKIDIEGAELEVLKAGDRVLQDCVALKVECSFLDQRMGQALIWDVAQYLIEQQFNVVELRDIHSWRRYPVAAHPYVSNASIPYSRGRIAQCDLVALRNMGGCSDDEQALRLVVLSAAMGYFDYSMGVVRRNPGVAHTTREKLDAEFQDVLAEWSRSVGKMTARKTLFSHLRGISPLGKSILGGVQAAERFK